MISLFHQFFLFILEVLASLLFITGYSKLTKCKKQTRPLFRSARFSKRHTGMGDKEHDCYRVGLRDYD